MSSFRPIFAAVLSVLVAAGSVAHAAPATRPADGRMETAPPERKARYAGIAAWLRGVVH